MPQLQFRPLWGSTFDPAKDTPSLNAVLEEIYRLLGGNIDSQNIAPGGVQQDNLSDDVVIPPSNAVPNLPSSISLTSGIRSDTQLAYIDVTWAQTGATEVKRWEVRWRRLGETVYSYTQTGVQSLRMEGLFPGTDYEVGVAAISRSDISSGYAVADETITTALDTNPPAQVTGLSVSAAFQSVMAVWTDLGIPDLDYYEVQIATNNLFSTGVETRRERGAWATFTGRAVSTQYFVRVRAVDLSGVAGAWSAIVSATTAQILSSADLAADIIGTVQLADNAVASANIVDLAVITAKIANLAVATGKIADLAVTNAKIANLAVDSAKIADLTVGTGKIANAAITTAKIGNLQVTNALINDLAVSKLTAGAMTAQVLLSGNIRTADSGARVLIDSSGVKLYNSSNVVVVNLDTVTGSGTFTGTVSSSTITGSTITGSTITGGTIRTASSGRRVELNSTAFEAVNLYTGDASEITPGQISVAVTGSGGARRTQLFLNAPKFQSGFAATYITMLGKSQDGVTQGQLRLGADDGGTIITDTHLVRSAKGGYPYLDNQTNADIFMQTFALTSGTVGTGESMQLNVGQPRSYGWSRAFGAVHPLGSWSFFMRSMWERNTSTSVHCWIRNDVSQQFTIEGMSIGAA